MIEIIEFFSKAIAFCSLLVIVYGIVRAIISFAKNEFKKEERASGIRKVRVDFGGYLLFGLELLIGADILKSVVEPSYEELIVLGGIVVLRTILSLFLNKEIKELES